MSIKKQNNFQTRECTPSNPCSITHFQKIGSIFKKILFVFAHFSEAQPFIAHTHALPSATEYTRSNSEPYSLFEFHQGWIAISGIGLHAAQMTVAQYGHSCDEIWNAGFAGSLQDSIPIGEMFAISMIGKYVPLQETLDKNSQELVITTTPHFILKDGATKLISSDFPIHDACNRNHLKKHWDLVDMEGYGVAYASAALQKKCCMWKIISDFASPGGREYIHKHKAMLAEKMAETLVSHLHQVNSIQ